MNHCCFYGKIASKTKEIIDAVDYIKIKLIVEKYRKNKNKDTKKDFSILMLEAWGSASITIDNYSEIGDYLLVSDATAKNLNNSAENVYFRINEFKIIKNFDNMENWYEYWRNSSKQ